MKVLWVTVLSSTVMATLALRAQDAGFEERLRSLALSPAGLFARETPRPCSEYVVEEDYYVEERFEPPLRMDFLAGAIVPFEQSGLAFGSKTSSEKFEAGAIIGLRFQYELVQYLFFGVEFDFASHDVDTGDVLFEGDLDRLYFLFPLTLSLPLGPRRYPVFLEFSVAPGVQVALPDVDKRFRDEQAFFFGRFFDEDDFAAFDLRAAVALRLPLGPWTRFFVELSYDWAVGKAETEVFEEFFGRVERREDQVDLSALNVLVGLSFGF
jgi:hypothetical protein